MSDSDGSDTYSDYLKSRQAVVHKKRVSAATYDSDSDDDFEVIKPVTKKKREENIIEEDDDSFVEKETHDQHLKSEIDKMEEQYRKQLYNKDEFMIGCSSGTTSNNVLTKTMRICDAIDGEESENEGFEIEECDPADTSVCKQFIPVTLEILDCEKGNNGKQRQEVSLDSSFYNIRKALATSWDCEVDAVVLAYNGITVPESATPKSLGIRPLQIPHPVIEAFKKDVVAREGCSIDDNAVNEFFTIKVQLQNRKKPVLVHVKESTTILQIKERVIQTLSEEQDSCIPTIEQMRVMFDDEYIEDDDATCGSFGFEDADCLDIYI